MTNIKTLYARNYRDNNRVKYNEYCNKWYHEHKEQQREYRRNWRLKKVAKAKEKGILNAWDYVNFGKPPIYEGGTNEECR